MGRQIVLTVNDAADGLRLDQAIAQLCPDISRTEARRLIARGSVFLGKKRVKVAGRIVHREQRIDVHPSELLGTCGKANVPVVPPTVLLHTENLLVVDKPSGMMSAPTPETDQHDAKSLLEGDHGPLYLVHRLDCPTSGLLLFARTSSAAASLSRQLADRTLSRTYQAILAGHPANIGSTLPVSTPVAEQEAYTEFQVDEQNDRASLVTATLRTGRTHQIRIHAASLGCPVLGDAKHGRWQLRGLPKPPRLALHAVALAFLDPETAEKVTVHSPFPEILRSYFHGLC